MNFTLYSIRINTDGIHDGVYPSVEISGALKAIKNVKISTIFQCDGLILCTPRSKSKGLLVWNPFNGERKWIKRRDFKEICGSYALGYGNSSYKILMLRYYELMADSIHVSEFEIYDLSSDSWKVIDGGLTSKITLLSSGVSLRENAYWMAFDGETGVFMLSFDFRTERFGRVALPFQSEEFDDTVVLSVVKDGQLSVLYENPYSETVKIWVSDEISEGKEVSWSEFLEVDVDGFMIEDMNLGSFLLDEENEVAVCCDTERLGNEGGVARIFVMGKERGFEVFNDEIRKGRSFHGSPLLLSYVPSLVRLHKDKAKGKRKRTTGRRLAK